MPEPRTLHPASYPAPAAAPRRILPEVLSVLALAAGFALSVFLVGWAVAVSFCGLFGETCTPEEEALAGQLLLGALATFLGIPALVAVLRRQARWLLAPVLEAILVAALFGLVAVF